MILTSIASGSKVVFSGDHTQLDNPNNTPYVGLAALIENLKGQAMFGHNTLEKSVRSPLAELAANIL